MISFISIFYGLQSKLISYTLIVHKMNKMSTYENIKENRNYYIMFIIDMWNRKRLSVSQGI